MSQSLHPMLNIAIKAARAAGAIINRGSQDLDILKISSKGPNDFVSEIDQMAEQAESRHVGEGVDAGRLAKIAAERIELGR